MFLGRKEELRQLNRKFDTEKSELLVIYGRLRIGKSSLVDKFAEDKKFFRKFEGIEGGTTKVQIASFMVKRIIHSKALYGRITLEILLQGLPPNEASC